MWDSCQTEGLVVSGGAFPLEAKLQHEGLGYEIDVLTIEQRELRCEQE